MATLRRLLHLTQWLGAHHRHISLAASTPIATQQQQPTLRDFMPPPPPAVHDDSEQTDAPPYVEDNAIGGRKRVRFEVYGCQMNVSDAEVAWSLLRQRDFQQVSDVDSADVVLLVTCSIRENAESKIWQRLHYLSSVKKRRPLKIGVLGCMAERLRKQIVDRTPAVDVVAGPDSYRHLAQMLTDSDQQTQINTILSADETYADIRPVQLARTNPTTAFVSIQRGCDNMCSFCIVPFVRGRERSRPIASLVDEIRQLSESGVRQVTLLGQNVNSYRDLSESQHSAARSSTHLSAGFRENYRAKSGGSRFADLLDRVSLVDREMRIRFTSPHPKDFPPAVLDLIAERPNICRHIHLPAQSGNSAMLERMRRGYTREAYLELVDEIRARIPDVALTSDFIAGFCGESEEEHRDTLSLIDRVRYQFIYTFPYSMRAKTRAYHRLVDDVPLQVKKRRHIEIADRFRAIALECNHERVGTRQIALVEKESRRSADSWQGRVDSGVKCVFPKRPPPLLADLAANSGSEVRVGDYVAVQIVGATSQTLLGVPLYRTTLQQQASIAQ